MSEPKEKKELFDFIRDECIRRYDAPFVHDDKDGKRAFSMQWFPKRGGRQAIMNIQEKDTNGLRVEFNKNAAKGMYEAVGGTDWIDVYLDSDIPKLRFARVSDSIFFGFCFHLDKVYHAGLDTTDMVLNLIWSLLMA